MHEHLDMSGRVKLIVLRVVRFGERHDDEAGEHVFHETLHFVTEHLPHFLGTFGHG